MLSLREMKTGDFAQYSRCFGLDGLEVVTARWVEHSFAPHMHDFYAVYLHRPLEATTEPETISVGRLQRRHRQARSIFVS